MRFSNGNEEISLWNNEELCFVCDGIELMIYRVVMSINGRQYYKLELNVISYGIL